MFTVVVKAEILLNSKSISWEDKSYGESDVKRILSECCV